MSQVLKILIADDDLDLRAALAEQLALHEEFIALETGTARGALETARQELPDIVIMDVGLPDMDGRAAVRQLRETGFNNPIIMLTALNSESDTVEGFDAGANDYVSKPFRFAELLARIRAHLRQREASEEALFRIGPYTFKPGTKHLIGEKGDKLRLTEKETAILRFLYRAGQTVIPREVLLREVWGYNSNVTTHTLETHIYRLRQKIERDPAKAQLLVTAAGGYKLIP
ncbi:MAG TPA: response regulator transcription factor [Methylocella sp.]|nr:response regulator transcription factor [Methylocella sp.]